MVKNMNIQFEYLYRDAGNNKKWGEVIFTNKKNVDKKSLVKQLENGLIDEEFFIGEKSRLPKLEFLKIDPELDHDWYEFHSLEETNSQQNDKENRDIEKFISDILDR
jgi:hypothetical protein